MTSTWDDPGHADEPDDAQRELNAVEDTDDALEDQT